jgi:exosome complex component RRP41
MLSECFTPQNIVAKDISGRFDENGTSFQVGVMKSASIIGSSVVQLGGAKVLCQVLCPRAAAKAYSRIGQLSCGAFECEVVFANFLTDITNSTVDFGVEEVRLSRAVQEALEPAISAQFYPKGLITLSVTILQSSANNLSAIINGGALALADAAVEMIDLCCSCSISRTELTSSCDEVQSVTVTAMPSLGVVTGLSVEGRMDAALLVGCVERLTEHCAQIRVMMIQALHSSTQ